MKHTLHFSPLAAAVAAVLVGSLVAPVAFGDNSKKPRADKRGQYVSGDFHNHTTCSDGSLSLQNVIKKSMDTTDTPWGLDWFVQAGHGGNGNRNCTLV